MVYIGFMNVYCMNHVPPSDMHLVYIICGPAVYTYFKSHILLYVTIAYHRLTITCLPFSGHQSTLHNITDQRKIWNHTPLRFKKKNK